MDLASCGDGELVAMSRKGDRAAFAELVRRTSRGLYARLYAQVQDAADAEDLLQETYLVAWKRLGQVTDGEGFRAWLLAIARTVVIDAARHKKRLKRVMPAGVLGFLGRDGMEEARAASPAGDAAGEAMRAEERGQVIEALASLPAGYREPLLMRYIGGADYETILRELKLTDGQLRGLLHRGMGMLRARLAERGIDEC